MEQKLEQFRLDSLKATEVQAKHLDDRFGKLSIKWINDAEIKDELLRINIHKLLSTIQLGLANGDRNTMLNRVKAISEIIIKLCKQEDVVNELTKVAGRYVKEYRKIKAGVFIERDLGKDGEEDVKDFYQQIVNIQKELLETSAV